MRAQYAAILAALLTVVVDVSCREVNSDGFTKEAIFVFLDKSSIPSCVGMDAAPGCWQNICNNFQTDEETGKINQLKLQTFGGQVYPTNLAIAECSSDQVDNTENVRNGLKYVKGP
ncbi:hypothetical protein CBOM_01698 [Ceraceosorus bombacis]|uniref:Uncharacterized protein n=1 Tax=Ceraceosorus bombacis TaxID=401625 RepID=A0A0N7L9H5_9BASI|nr:hypothetical protein CBOM_01698 [Ceraceosorus bombacis]